MSAAANTIALAIQDRCSILRFSLDADSPEDIEVLPSKRAEDSVQHLFLDPTGHHLIICLQNGDNYYLHSRSTRPKKLSRLQGNVESVAFDRQSGTETVTKSFLVGTSTGFIYEMSLESGGKERTCHLIYQLDQPLAITSIYFETISNGDRANAADSAAVDSSAMSTSVSAARSTAASVVSLGTAALGTAASASSILGGVISGSTFGGVGGDRSEGANGGDDRAAKAKSIVMFTTTSPTRLYHFVGAGTFKEMFLESSPSFAELPGEVDRAELHCFSKFVHSRAQTFAIATAMGIYHGSLSQSQSQSSSSSSAAYQTWEESVLMDAQLMPYTNTTTVTLSPQQSGGDSNIGNLLVSQALPLSIAATEFHFLVLTQDRLQTVSRLNGSVEQDEDVLRFVEGLPLGLLRDSLRGTLWLYTTSAVYQIVCINESRRVWSIYLERALGGSDDKDDKLFDKALEFCQKKEEEEYVSRARAEFCLSQGKLEQAAHCFSKANLPFDEVALPLLRATSASTEMPLTDFLSQSSGHGESISKALGRFVVSPVQTQSLNLSHGPELTALRVYLQEQLMSLPLQSKSQRTMVCTWLSEIFLHQITTLVLSPSPPSLSSPSSSSLSPPSVSVLVGQFKDFLRANKSHLDQATTLSLLNSRGTQVHRALALFFAQIVGNYDLVISRYLSDGRFADAIAILADAPFEKVEAIVYKSAPLLIENEPEACVNMFLAQTRLKPASLLPALLRYSTQLDKHSKGSRSNQDLAHVGDAGGGVSHHLETDFEGHRTNFAVKYLQAIVERASAGGFLCESIVYHTLVWFLAKYDSSSEDGLVAFLQPHFDRLLSEGGGSSVTIGFDMDHVLRQCKRYGRRRSTVLALMMTGLEEEAVAMALSLDVALAKSLASKVKSDSRKRKLWLNIALYTIRTEKNPASSLRLIEESDGVLRIDDILQHLPDFTDVDLLQDKICRTLESFGDKIESLKAEMSELSESAESINRELEGMSRRGYSYSTIQRCEDCSDTLFNKQFYLFPCSHGFHSHCLMKRVQRSVDEATRNKLRSLEEQVAIAAIRAKDLADKRAAAQYEYLQSELDGHLGSDCPFCGQAMIDSLAVPLIHANEADDVSRWAL